MTSNTPPHAPQRIGRDARILIAVVFVTGLGFVWFADRLPGVMQSHEAPPEKVISFDPTYTDDERKMYMLFEHGGAKARDAIDEVVRNQDARFIAPLVDVMRMIETRAMFRGGLTEIILALDRLSGEKLRGTPGTSDLTANHWVPWIGHHDELKPPPGYVEWKGRLFGVIDPSYQSIFYEGVPTAIRVEEILYRGGGFDNPMSLDNPATLAGAKAAALSPDEPVFGLEINGEARAYPHRFLDSHELVNDVVGDVPVSLVYCTMCGAAIAYDGRASDGQTYTFGSAGLVYRSNTLIFDRETQTLWNHLEGRPVVGALAGTDVKLEQLPLVTASWADWQKTHPETKVLVIEPTERRRYRLGEPYGFYFRSRQERFPLWETDDRLPLKTRIFGLRVGEELKAYRLGELTDRRVVNDVVAGQPMTLIAGRGSVEVNVELAFGRRQIRRAVSYDAGGEVRAYQTQGQRFQPATSPDFVIDADGQQWQVTEDALAGPDGQKLKRIPGHLAYWLGWYAAFPKTAVYQAD